MGRVRRRRWGKPGEIDALLDLFTEHRGAFEYDWRTRFRVPLTEVGESMTWGEAWRLFELLAIDGSSQIGAAMSGWTQPATRTDLTLRDLYDLQHRSKAKRKPEQYPRPWDKKTSRVGAGTSLTIAEFKAIKANLMGTVTVPRPRDALGRFVKRS